MYLHSALYTNAEYCDNFYTATITSILPTPRLQ
jgi:hypothetical protein